ncbi:hypothetical protein [Streptosporangium roseum]|uniref:hypothetical protein n=1 Tax=Streptosporangium roseum TaxID=2001 RepID=UPI00332A909D
MPTPVVADALGCHNTTTARLLKEDGRSLERLRHRGTRNVTIAGRHLNQVRHRNRRLRKRLQSNRGHPAFQPLSPGKDPR